MRNLKKKNFEYNKVIVCFIVFCLIMIVPTVIYAGVSIPAADDYSNAVNAKKYWENYSSTFIASIVQSRDLFMQWGGSYFSGFLNFFFVPFLRWGIPGIRVFNVVASVIFYLSSYFLIHVFAKELLKKGSAMTWMLYCTFLFSLINNTRNSEIYSWYCVMSIYIVPISLMMCALALFIFSITREGHFYIVAAALAFLSSGSNLNITALNCGMILLLGIYGFIYYDRKKESLTVFAFALAGALLNVAAPGNYVRHDAAETEYRILGSLKDAVVYSLQSLEYKCLHTPFLAVLIVLILISYIYIDVQREKFTFKYPILGLLVVILGISVVNFPVMLGGATFVPDRCVFVQDLATYMLLYPWVLYLTGWIKKTFGVIAISKDFICSSFISCFLFSIVICGMNGGHSGFTTGYMISSIVNGRLKQYIEYQEGIIEEIEDAGNDDIIIYRPSNLKNPYMKSIGITSDSHWWVNAAISTYYGKKSITIIYTDE